MHRPTFQERLRLLFTRVFHDGGSAHRRYVDRIAGVVAQQLAYPVDTPLHEIDLLPNARPSSEVLLGCHLAVALTWELAVTAARDELHRQDQLLRCALVEEPQSPARVAAARSAMELATSLVDRFERRAPTATT